MPMCCSEARLRSRDLRTICAKTWTNSKRRIFRLADLGQPKRRTPLPYTHQGTGVRNVGYAHPVRLDANLTFIPGDVPRDSWFALWDPLDQGGLFDEARQGHDGASSGADDFESVQVSLTVPAKRGTTVEQVGARRVPMAALIDAVAHLPKSAEAGRSTHAWAGVVRTALTFIAEGRVLPWISPLGFDTWRVDPLTPSQVELVAACSQSLPAEAHCTPGSRRGTIADAEFTVRAVFDAVADTFLRTPAAHRVSSLKLFADPRPTRVDHLRPWVNELATAHCASSRLILRAHPPADPDEAESDGDFENADRHWTIRFQLQSRVDPSLVIDAADFWKTPAAVMERLGQQAEITLLAGLRRAGQLVPPLGRVLDENAPTVAALHDDDLDLLLDSIDDLTDADIEVRFPSELISPRIERKLVIAADAAPTGAMASVLSLENLVDVDWEFLIEGVALTKVELEVLGNAKRAVVPLRGKWVQLDRAARERLKNPPPKLTPGDLLQAAMRGTLVTDNGELIDVRFEGAVEDLSARLAALATEREQNEPPTLKAELRPYQKRGLAWMSDLCSLGLGGVLADDMGLGKTIQLLALHAHRQGQQRPGLEHDRSGSATLVVCPTSLLNNWAREAEKFLPDTSVHAFHGPHRSLDGVGDGDIVLTTYGVVRSDTETLASQTWDLVVADEAQHIKNPRSRSAKVLREIPGGARIALTGTPVENRLSELWAIIDWVVPGLLGPLQRFKREIATPIERDDDKRAARELSQLVKPFMLRRRKTDPGIAPELPPKLERDVIVPLTPEQVTLYKATVEHSLVEVGQAEGIARRGLVLKLLTGLKQIANHPAQFLGEPGPLAERSGKLEALDQLLESARQAGEATLVFTQYVKMGELVVRHLAERGHSIDMLHGGQSVKARQRLVDRFQTGELDVLVLSLKAGGTGLNLTAATNVVHYDRWWNPAVEDQATDRAYRIGQKQTVTVHRIITEGTIEDRVAELLRNKRQLADRVVGGGEGWIGELSDDELSDLVSLETASC